MKKAIAIIFCCFSALVHHGQQRYTDSLLHLYNQSTDDSARIMLLCMISDDHSLAQADSAMYYAQAALMMSREKGFRKGEARSLTRVGNLLKANGEFPKAYETHLTSLKISEGINDLVGMAASNNNIAEILKEQATYQTALEYYWKANKSFENIIKNLEAASPKNETLVFYNKSYLAITFLNIGDCFERMEKYDSALHYHYQAYDISLAIGDQGNLGAILNNLGSVYYKKRSFDASLWHYRKALPYLEAIDDKQFLSNARQGMSEVYLKMNKPDSAIYFARESLNAAVEGSFTKEIYIAQLLLSSLFEAVGNTDSAFYYQKAAIVTKDTLFNLEKANKVQALNNSEQFRQLELAAAREKEEKERKDNLQMIAITIFILTFFVVVIILGRQKARHRMVEYLGIIGLLLLFEFIALFIHPYIAHWTHHTPIYMLIILVGVAAILTPLHHQLTHWIRHSLLKQHPHPGAAKDPAPEVPEPPSAPQTPAVAPSPQKVIPIAKNNSRDRKHKPKKR